MSIPTIINDERPIQYIGGDNNFWARRGVGGVTSIVPYLEHCGVIDCDGAVPEVLWFAVCVGGTLPTRRIHSKEVTRVDYAEPPELAASTPEPETEDK